MMPPSNSAAPFSFPDSRHFDRRKLDAEMKERIDRVEAQTKELREVVNSIQGNVRDILEIVDSGKAFFHGMGVMVKIASRVARLLSPIIALGASIYAIWQWLRAH